MKTSNDYLAIGGKFWKLKRESYSSVINGWKRLARDVLWNFAQHFQDVHISEGIKGWLLILFHRTLKGKTSKSLFLCARFQGNFGFTQKERKKIQRSHTFQEANHASSWILKSRSSFCKTHASYIFISASITCQGYTLSHLHLQDVSPQSRDWPPVVDIHSLHICSVVYKVSSPSFTLGTTLRRLSQQCSFFL